MGRVSLTESYDDRSVISKLNEMDKRVKENTTVVTSAEAAAQASAQAAQETADRFAGSVGAVVQNANAQINASKAQVDQAKAEVDETVTTVAQAVQTANNASASAQQSAQTVATYDTRLTAAETKNTQQDTAISELQTADTQNVKLHANYQQDITGALVFNGADKIIVKDPSNFGKSVTVRHNDVELGQPIANPRYWNEAIGVDKNGNTLWQIEYDHLGNGDANLAFNLIKNDSSTKSGITITKRKDVIIPQVTNLPSGAPSTAIVNKAYVESTDGETNNLVHRTSAETINGVKTFTSPLTRSITNGGQACINAIGVQGNTYAIVGLDTNNVQRHILNMQIGSDNASRYSLQLRTHDYSATTGYDCSLTLELTTSGRLRLVLYRTDKSTGEIKSHVIGELQ